MLAAKQGRRGRFPSSTAKYKYTNNHNFKLFLAASFTKDPQADPDISWLMIPEAGARLVQSCCNQRLRTGPIFYLFFPFSSSPIWDWFSRIVSFCLFPHISPHKVICSLALSLIRERTKLTRENPKSRQTFDFKTLFCWSTILWNAQIEGRDFFLFFKKKNPDKALCSFQYLAALTSVDKSRVLRTAAYLYHSTHSRCWLK